MVEDNRKNICELDDGTVVVCQGPLLASIYVSKGYGPDPATARSGANKAIELLGELAHSKAIIKQNITKVNMSGAYPEIVSRMIASVQCLDDPSMTPLVAVAGTVADEVAELLFEKEGVCKVIVNNGGDIAIRLANGQVAKVGVRADRSKKESSHILTVNATSNVGGICTSGFGGRSFTKGIASAAVVCAPSASVADALATCLGNATNVDDIHIERQRAEKIYPDTDIPREWVTTLVGDISQDKIDEALERGMAFASKLHQRGLVFETLLAVKGQARMTKGILSMISSARPG